MGMILRALALLTAGGAAAQEAPGVFAAPAHALTVRDRPGGAPIGELTPGARPLEVAETDRRGAWGRIGFGEGDGWVALDALTPAEAPAAPYAAIPLGLLCVGVEPFWSLRFGPDGAVAESPDAPAAVLPVTAAAPAAGRERFPMALRIGGQTAVLRPAACSDGMSDRTDPWTVDVIAGEALRTGCCRLPVAP